MQPSPAPTGAAPPGFSPQALMGLYLRGRHDELSESFLAILRHFRDATYHTLDPQGQRFVNEFVKAFLHLFTQDDYAPSPAHLAAFVRLNPTIANLVALSCFGTADPFLSLLRGRPGGFGKVLTLLSPRNASAFDPRAFFDHDPTLASAWYGAYAEGYRSALPRPDVSDRLAAHFRFTDDRLDARAMALDAYFASSYVDGACDRVVKPALNAGVRRVLASRGLRVRNRPDPRKVAVLSGNWSPAHSVHRINYGYLQALEGYHLTFFPLSRRPDLDTSLFHDVRPLDIGPDGVPDLAPLLDNEFQVAYYPDVGLTAASIWLANLRLAPIQVCSLGHSVSTFGAEIDYVLSGSDVEPPDDPERNYSERLVLLPGWGAVHSRPGYTPSGRRPPGDVFVLNGPWNAPKVNYRFALTLQELLRRCRRPVRLRLFVSASLNRQNDYLPFVRDLQALLGADAVEVCLGLPYAEYMAEMEQGDACLDSYHFGGCNTVADALHLRKLIVCREGDRWYNRIGPAMLRSVGLPELATTTEEQFLDAALRLIHDDAFRADLQHRLDRADLDATVFRTADARYFGKALDHLIRNHSRLRREGGRSPIRVERD